MASIRKRNGKFQAQIRRSGFKTFSRTFHKRKDALEWAYHTELKADRRGLADNTKSLETITLSNLLKRYRDAVIPHKKGAKNETIILNAFLKQDICRKFLAEITSNDFEEYKNKRLKFVLGSTINREFNIIRHAYNTAINVWEMPITKNPLNSIKKAPTPRSRQKRLNNTQAHELLAQASNVRNKYIKPLIVFALETGMRRSEILNITYEHINFKNKTLFIPDFKTGHARTIPLSERAIQTIPARRTQGLTFPIKIKVLEFHWCNIRANADLKDFHFHDLRHEAISRFFERGLSVPEVALITGNIPKTGKNLLKNV